ncbi:hypothetical protein BC937DRAFT_87684 [Endogone sp. FLAS-F59071]|nr:hypothetical protein BC937DRAFT_87684 [Endogone sp. FLAS-F59071]|eukprot:RUS22702.1 hypothetical protein BC937DRAFT_87684 [Endogone sp. FLAS-F59071]
MKAEELFRAYSHKIPVSSVPVETKRWTVDGAIKTKDIDSVYYVDPAENKENQRFLASIKSSQILMLMGARASGKSTRLYRLMSQLAEDGYRCYIVSFEGVAVDKSTDTFWTTLGRALQRNYSEHGRPKDIKSSDDFLNAFGQNAWKQKIVIFIDEFDKLFDASDKIRDECLQTFREIRNNNHLYAIRSIVTCGTFSIQHLNSVKAHIAPFNVAQSFGNPYFSAQQTQRLFDEFAQNEKTTIDHDVVDAIHLGTNGHPAMICLCGRAIADSLQRKSMKQ